MKLNFWRNFVRNSSDYTMNTELNNFFEKRKEELMDTTEEFLYEALDKLLASGVAPKDAMGVLARAVMKAQGSEEPAEQLRGWLEENDFDFDTLVEKTGDDVLEGTWDPDLVEEERIGVVVAEGEDKTWDPDEDMDLVEEGISGLLLNKEDIPDTVEDWFMERFWNELPPFVNEDIFRQCLKETIANAYRDHDEPSTRVWAVLSDMGFTKWESLGEDVDEAFDMWVGDQVNKANFKTYPIKVV